MSDRPVPAILGWTPAVSAIVASGVIIAIIVGWLGMAGANPVGPPAIWLLLIGIPLAVISTLARIVLRKKRSLLTPIAVSAIFLKLANMVAVALLGLAVLIAFLINSSHRQTLLNALILDLVLAFAIGIVTTIAINLAALVASPSRPSTPPA